MCIIDGSPSGTKKPAKKVCFAAGTAPGSAESAAAADDEALTSKDGDETDGDETGEEDEGEKEEPIPPHKEGAKEMRDDKAKEGESSGNDVGGVGDESSAAAKKAETEAGSMMDVDEGDPTLAYDLETDEDNTDQEEEGGECKSEEKTEGKGGAVAVELTIPYNLKEENGDGDSEDSDRTDAGEKEEEKKEASESVAETSKLETKAADKVESGSSKKEGDSDRAADECGDETGDEGDTDKVESSETEPESQEVKEKRELNFKIPATCTCRCLCC